MELFNLKDHNEQVSFSQAVLKGIGKDNEEDGPDDNDQAGQQALLQHGGVLLHANDLGGENTGQSGGGHHIAQRSDQGQGSGHNDLLLGQEGQQEGHAQHAGGAEGRHGAEQRHGHGHGDVAAPLGQAQAAGDD